MPTIKVNDINIYYETQGEGAPLVLIPGLNNDISEYKEVIARLSCKYQVVALDHRGAGRTDKPDIPYSIEMMADDTAGLLAALGIPPAHILGISLGGRITMALALRHPEQVKSLILVSTSARVQQSWSRFLLKFMLRIPMIRGPQPYYAVARQYEASRNYDCTARLHEIQVPTLILHGKKDRLAPYKLAEELHAGITGSKMIAFNGGHLFLFFQPRPFIDAVLEFLDQIARQN